MKLTDEFMQVFDADGSGTVSKEEYIETFATLFDKEISTIILDGKNN